VNKFKSPPACFFTHKAFTLQRWAAPQATYILPILRALAHTSAKSKRPLPNALGQHVLPTFSAEAGEDDKPPSHLEGELLTSTVAGVAVNILKLAI